MSLVDLGKRLLEAAKTGSTEEVRALMSNGAPFTTDWLGTSPLHYAAQQGHVETAEVLLRAGISRDARTKVDRTPLHAASQEGHQDVVDLLIKNGADIEAKDMLKMTPLHWAVEKGHVGVIDLLLGHGSDINVDNKFDKSPVEIAINNGRADIAEILQLARLPQQNVVEVTTDQTVVEEVAETTNIETLDDGAGFTVTDGDGTEQSSTAVLATLAALAEATGPLNSSSTTNTTAAEALHWLESHGITMISGDGQSNLVESGQSLSLTEAGKLALDFVKQKVIVSNDDNQLTAQSEDGTPMVIRLTESGEAVAEPMTDQDEPLLKKIKLEDSIPEGYVLAKTEPEDDLYGAGDVQAITTETITEEGVTIDGGMIITEDGVIVTEEGYVMQEGLEGITVQSEITQHTIEEEEDEEGDVHQEEQLSEQVVHHEEQYSDAMLLQEHPDGMLLQEHPAEGELLQEEELTGQVVHDGGEVHDGTANQEIQDFEVIHDMDEQNLQVDDVQQETIETTEQDELDIRDELDEITSKT